MTAVIEASERISQVHIEGLVRHFWAGFHSLVTSVLLAHFAHPIFFFVIRLF